MLRLVQTENGFLRGLPCGNPRITVFRGVPYAAPPVGDLRWEAPRPCPSWEGIRDAARFAPMAMQGRLGTDPNEFYTRELHPTAAEYPISEDCLYLNVWTPAETSEERLPVLFYIHGGGLTCGYSYEMEFDGEHVARKGCILVTPGYRLGAFGFLAHPEMTDPAQGNYGFLDQVTALQWVRRNIASFGGDPDRITIAGQSAGAGSVTALLCSPKARGLFKGAILMSGGGVHSSGRFAVSLKEAQKSGSRLFRRLGVATPGEARALPAETVLEADRALRGEDPEYGRMPSIVFASEFMPEHPLQVMLSGNLPRIPLMIGCCRDEGKFFSQWNGPLNSPQECEAFIRRIFRDEAETVLQTLDIRSETGVERFKASDGINAFRLGQEALARLALAQGIPVYQYLFNHDIPGEDHAGSYHGSDLWFVFDSLGRCWRPFTGKHYDLARAASSYFVNFVRSGDPNGTDWLGFPLPRWDPYTRESPSRICFEDVPVCRKITGDSFLDLRLEALIRDIREKEFV